MTRLSAANLETLRSRPQQTKLYLSIYEPQIVFQARINNGSISRGARTIAYDSVSLGNFNAIKAGATMWIGTTAGANDVGKIRVRSATSSEIIVSENSNIEWADNLFLTIFYYFELWPVFPRVIPDPNNIENVIFYKDYDIAYTNQNSIFGTFVNIGPHRAANLDPASNQAQLYWSSTGTYNILGHPLTYDWWFQGATITGSSSADPGFRTYNQPGNYVTRLTVTDTINGATDTTYRYVRIHSPADPSVQKWQLSSLSGSRDQGGYTASFRVFEDIPIQEHAVVVIYAENWYGSTKQNIGGNYPNGGNIFWVGYVDQDSIRRDYQHSEIAFTAHSITGMMKESSGFSISVESKANPAAWFELLDMDGRRALYHYLRWHTTALNIADFQFVGNDYKTQFFDSDRESMFDALDNYMRTALWGKVVSDRQGKVWIEVNAEAYTDPEASFSSVMDITNRDWMNEPTIEERLSEDVSFIEMGGVAYSGVVTGTFSALLGSAPGTSPGFHGSIETFEGLTILGQEQLNQLVGNVFANHNSPFPSVDIEMAINASNLDIAPQEGVGLNIAATDTVRNLAINALYLPNSMDWTYVAQDFILLPRIDFRQLVTGEEGETILVPPPEEQGTGFNVPPIQIPPLPPLTIPAYSIPTGTISAIIQEALIAYQAPFAYAQFIHPNLNSDSRGLSVLVTDMGANMVATFTSITQGIYWAGGQVRPAGLAGTDEFMIRVNGVTKYASSVGDVDGTKSASASGLLSLGSGDVVTMQNNPDGGISDIINFGASLVRISA